MRDKVRLALLFWLVLLAAGCMKARVAALPVIGPPLEVPNPPPRVVVPVEAEAPPPPSVPSPDEPRRPAVVARPRPAPVEAPKAAVEEPPKPAGPTAAETPPAPTTALQTTPAAQQGEVERAIRATLTKASADLNKIDYRALNANARTQYDTAKRFIQQASDAIRMKNLPFAKNLADKAAALAVQLGGQ
jgi:hypothetical protein